MIRGRNRLGSALIVALALGVIGCGGGGGGGSTGAVVITGGSNGGSGNGSAGGSTSGGTTSGDTGSTGTAGDPTTGSGTAGDSGGTASGPAPGSLRANAIYFGHWDDASVVTSILPDGSGRQDVGSGHAGVSGAAPDPDDATKTIYAIDRGGLYGVYRGSTYDPSASETLATAIYDSVSALLPTANGSVVMVASRSGVSKVFLLEGGTVRAIDEADSAAVSLDGTQIAYTKLVNGLDELFVWSRSSATSRRVATGGDSLFPSFSKDGSWILFSSNRDGSGDTPWDLYQVPAAGGTVERITTTPDVSEFGACYNEARTLISTVGLGPDPDLNGVFVISNTATVRIASDPDVNMATYWTNALGRSSRSAARGARFSLLTLPRRR